MIWNGIVGDFKSYSDVEDGIIEKLLDANNCILSTPAEWKILESLTLELGHV